MVRPVEWYDPVECYDPVEWYDPVECYDPVEWYDSTDYLLCQHKQDATALPATSCLCRGRVVQFYRLDLTTG